MLLGRGVACVKGFRFVAGIDIFDWRDYMKGKDLDTLKESLLQMSDAIVNLTPDEFAKHGGFTICIKPGQILLTPPGTILVEVPLSASTYAVQWHYLASSQVASTQILQDQIRYVNQIASFDLKEADDSDSSLAQLQFLERIVEQMELAESLTEWISQRSNFSPEALLGFGDINFDEYQENIDNMALEAVDKQEKFGKRVKKIHSALVKLEEGSKEKNVAHSNRAIPWAEVKEFNSIDGHDLEKLFCILWPAIEFTYVDRIDETECHPSVIKTTDACDILKAFLDRKATAPLDEIRELQNYGISPIGCIAAPSRVTLSDEVKRSLGIPAHATEYAWAYPVSPGKWTSEALGYFSTSTPSAAFFIYGGYIYFDKMGRVAAVCAISLGNGLEFEPAEAWDNRYSGALEKRWVPVTVPYILERGARHFAWINGGELLQPSAKDVLGGQDWRAPANGCFVYKFHESPLLADDRDVFFAVRGSLVHQKAFGKLGALEEQAMRQLRNQMGGDAEGCRKRPFFDANLDGRISEDEMATALKILCPRMTQEVIKNLFSQADLNKDGFVDVNEFVTLIPGLRWKTDKSDKEDWSWNTEEASGGSGGSEKEDGKGKAVVLTHRLPDDYLENTLLPHLESQLLYNIHIYTPAELTQIAKAYAKMEVRQLALCRKLAGHMKERMKGFEAIDVIDALGAMWIMVPDDEELFEALEQKIYEKMEDFTAPNFMGIIRVYNKMASKHHTLLSKVIPRLRELLANYEGVELSEMLVSMAQSVDSDMDILMTLVPEVEKRYNEVSLLHSVNNVWALCQMKISEDLPAGYMARVAWIYRRCNRWDLISEALLPMIRSSAAEFSPGDFARLAQALPEEGQLLRRIAQNLVGGFTDMGRKDFLLYLVGCVHGEVLEERPEANQPYGELTQASHQAVECAQPWWLNHVASAPLYIRSMPKGYNSFDDTDGSVTVREVLDDMPFGQFHVVHLTWAIVAIAILAIQYEMTPYMFLGLQLHFGAGREELSTFAAAFQAGCAFGTMIIAYALGSQDGRGIAIACSQYLVSDWQKLQKLQAITMLTLMAATRLINESPRFLASRGRKEEARQVLDAVHRTNGSTWNSSRQLCLDDTVQTLDDRSEVELFSNAYLGRITFCWTLFCLLACTTILLDTWGPLMYQHLLFPHRTVLPHGLLMLFNIGDFIGLDAGLASMFLQKKRFFLQGSILMLLAGVHQEAHKFGSYSIYLQSLLGVLAASCRSFAWEGAVMWALEVFPTSLRAAALSSSRTCMQLMAVLTLKVSAEYLSQYPAAQWLQLFGGSLIVAGVIVALCNPQETADVHRRPDLRSHHLKAAKLADVEQLNITLDSQLGSALLAAMAAHAPLWQDSLAVLAKMRGSGLEVTAENLGLCQCTLPFMFLLHCFGAVNLDTMVAQTWQELHSWPALHWAMIEALVAAVSFVGWISWFFLLNEIPSMKGYRMVVREESHPIGTHCMTDRTKHRVWASFPVYVLSIFALHLVKSAPKVQSEAPSTLRLFSELILGIWAYDFIFYWLHLAMHKFPNSWHKHEIHHELKVHPICSRRTWLGQETDADDRRPLQVFRLLSLSGTWRLDPSADLYQTALGGISSSSLLWAWALHLLEEMEALDRKPSKEDLHAAMQVISVASPEAQGFLELQAGYLTNLADCRWQRPRLALWLLVEMDKGAAEENWVSSDAITSAMAACAKCSFWVQTLELLVKLKERQLRPTSKTYGAAVASCAESLQQKQTDGRVFASAVRACRSRWELVLSALVAMREARVAPVASTYSDVLRLFTAKGKVVEAARFLEEPLRDKFGEIG
eukprot:g31329.t1